MSKQDDLKALNAKKKELNEEAKTLRDELNAGKAERIAARKEQAIVRKAIVTQKSDLRDLSASIYKTFSTGDAEAIDALADEIMEVATVLAGTVRAFAKASTALEDL